MSKWRSVGYSLELMFEPTRVVAELYDADDRSHSDPPIMATEGATADEAVKALFERITLDVDDDDEDN